MYKNKNVEFNRVLPYLDREKIGVERDKRGDERSDKRGGERIDKSKK